MILYEINIIIQTIPTKFNANHVKFVLKDKDKKTVTLYKYIDRLFCHVV